MASAYAVVRREKDQPDRVKWIFWNEGDARALADHLNNLAPHLEPGYSVQTTSVARRDADHSVALTPEDRARLELADKKTPGARYRATDHCLLQLHPEPRGRHRRV